MMHQTMPPGTPPEIATALAQLVEDLKKQAGTNFDGLVIFGGLAQGRYRPGRSDVNVIVLLKTADAKSLREISPALGDARRSVGICPMLLCSTEVASTAKDFPSKYLDIQMHHVVLHGSDPFESIRIPLAEVKRSVAQSLRNQLIRLRHRYLVQCDEPDGLRAALLAAARPLAIDLLCLLAAENRILPDEDRTAKIYQAASDAFNLDAATLGDLAALRDGAYRINPGDLLGRLLSLLSDLADRIDSIGSAP